MCFLFFGKAPPLSFRFMDSGEARPLLGPQKERRGLSPFGIRVDSSSFSVISSSRLRAGKLPVKRSESKYLSF